MNSNYYPVAILFKSFLAAVVFLGSCYGYGLLHLDDNSAANPFFELSTGFFTYVCDMPSNCSRKDIILLNYYGYGSYEYYDTCFVPNDNDRRPNAVKRYDEPVRCYRIIDPRFTSFNNYQPKPPNTFMPAGSRELCIKCGQKKDFEGYTRLFYWDCTCAEGCKFWSPRDVSLIMMDSPGNRKFSNLSCKAPYSGPNAYCDCPIKSSRWSLQDNVTWCGTPIYDPCPQGGVL